MNAEQMLSNLGLLGFAAASIAYLLAYSKGDVKTRNTKVAFAIFCGATVVETLMLAVRGVGGFNDAPGILLSATIAWLTIGGHVIFRMKPLGAFVAPLATLILLVYFFISPPGAPTTLGSEAGLLISVHVVTAVLGQAFAIVACGVSVLFLWQQSLLKRKMLDQLPAGYPALDKIDRILVESLWVGFSLITVSLLTGAIYSQQYIPRTDLQLEFKVIWAIVIWIWYLAILLAKNLFNRPAKIIAQMSLAGFLLLAMSYFGIGFFRPFGGA